MSNPDSLMPHAICWAADPRLVWTMVVTNAITFISYISIAATLLFLVRRTGRHIARDWGYFVVGFALFIVACGFTHLMDVVTTWIPAFWIGAWTSIVTAALSACVAIMFIRRGQRISLGINDYAGRLANTVDENQHMQESLIAAQRLKDWSRMSAVVSHEIKNPLQAIQNLQYMIRTSESVTPQVDEMARMAEEEAERVLTISDATLSFIRQASKPEMIGLGAAIESVRFLLAPLIREKSIEFEVESRGDCNITAFNGETRQVLLNVIRNACEAITTPGKHVRVELIGDSNGVEVSVSDEGVGIDPAVLPMIFQFGLTTKGDRGNGMGLWTVKHILDKHRGEVRVQSKPGNGTCVEMWWPRNFVPQAAQAS